MTRTDTDDPFVLRSDHDAITTLTLNRPRARNPLSLDMLEALGTHLADLDGDSSVRVVVITGAGPGFSAGHDLRELHDSDDPGFHQQVFAACSAVMEQIATFPKPTIALIQGACFGGGVGMVCCVDVALATPAALFGLTEVRVGVAPTPISTHMVNAMGLRQTRRYALTGERFDAAEALRIGLVHEVVAADAIEARLGNIVDAVLLGAPGAIAMTKDSFLGANGLKLDARQMTLLAHESWTQRHSAEAHEGTAAFREKRKPAWYKG